MTDAPAPERRFRFTLTPGIVVGLVIGGLLGWLTPEFAVKLKWISTLFLRLIKMVLGPLLPTTLVVGIAGAGGKMVGRLGLKAILWFEAATTVALFVGLAAANLVHPGTGVTLAAAAAPASSLAKVKTTTDFVLDAFPLSFIDAMARNDVLQIVVFSVFLGRGGGRRAVLGVGVVGFFGGRGGGPAGARAKPIKDVAEAGAEAMFKMVGYV